MPLDNAQLHGRGAPLDFGRVVDSEWWGDHGIPYAELAQLRETEPVWRYEGGAVDPFWLLTRHEDVKFVSRSPALFSSASRLILDDRRGADQPMRAMIQMDPPEHAQHRRLVHAWLTPKHLRAMESTMRACAREIVNDLATRGEGDLVADVAVRHPLRMICQILGVPPEGEAEVEALTKALFGVRDPDFAVDADISVAQQQIMGYCLQLAEARQADPRDDMASAIATAEIDGDPIGMRELLSNLLVIMTAGHDTTAGAIGGGLVALVERPETIARLQADPSLVASAIDEILRWVTPTTNFMRTAMKDVEIAGVRIPAGDDVCLQYAAANRDPEVFEAPDEFRIDRKPNPHLTFGVGPHTCVGQSLARMEMQTLLEELLPRIRTIELVGPVERVKTIWIAALKRAPVRCDIADGPIA